MKTTLRVLALSLAAGAAWPALAQSYYFRTKPLVEPPQAFSFAGRSGQGPGAVVESDATRVKGHRGRTATVSGGEYQVCATADCSGATWTTAPTANLPADFHARVRVTAAPFGRTASVSLAVGDASATFEAQTRPKDVAPDAIDFPPVAGAQPGTATKSAAVAVVGHDGVTLSVTNGGYQVCQTVACTEMDGRAVQTGASAEVASGTLVRLFVTPPAYGQTATATLRAGDTVGTFSATARGKDTTPATFQFASRGDQEPNQPSYSAPVVLSDFDGAPLSVTGGGYQICTNADCSANGGFRADAIAEVLPGTRIRLVATPPAFGQKASATLNVGGVSASYEATARARDITPDTIAGFANVTGATPSSDVLSAIRQVTGHDGVSVSVSGTGAQYRVCSTATCAEGPAWTTSSGTVPRDAYVQIKVTAGNGGENRTATLVVGPQTLTWTVGASSPTSGAVLAGSYGGRNIYVQISKSPTMKWATSQLNTQATSLTDGRSNYAAMLQRSDFAQLTAAAYCHNLVEGGYADWYLPAWEELRFAMNALGSRDNGKFFQGYHWSSSDPQHANAYGLDYSLAYGPSGQWFTKDGNAFYVRCIRS